MWEHAADNDEHLPPLDQWEWGTPAVYIRAHPEMYETFKARHLTSYMKALWSFREAGMWTVVATDRPMGSAMCPSLDHDRTLILYTNGDKVSKIRELEHSMGLYLVNVFEDAPHHIRAMFDDCLPVVPVPYPWNLDVIESYLEEVR